MQLATIKRIYMTFNDYKYKLQCETLRLLYAYPGLSYNVAYDFALSNMQYDDNKIKGWSNE